MACVGEHGAEFVDATTNPAQLSLKRDARKHQRATEPPGMPLIIRQAGPVEEDVRHLVEHGRSEPHKALGRVHLDDPLTWCRVDSWPAPRRSGYYPNSESGCDLPRADGLPNPKAVEQLGRHTFAVFNTHAPIDG